MSECTMRANWNWRRPLQRLACGNPTRNAPKDYANIREFIEVLVARDKERASRIKYAIERFNPVMEERNQFLVERDAAMASLRLAQRTIIDLSAELNRPLSPSWVEAVGASDDSE